ncbi:hypothetical protein ES288_A04G131700v1 [Gossypium darwinii]|uniref:Uncharacterized protein n=1 Tax=Gossypium darwinii TaxID=34276 RepID=A0A5D2GWA4_GOSDA|nr:hypothetical protein ES288_A04G131700v1 [Gossypium darwinii]
MQPLNHHHTVADSTQTMADFANGGELRLCPRWFGKYGKRGLDVVRGCMVNGSGERG